MKLDIKLNDVGIWEWNTDKVKLIKQVYNYFFERNEDDNLSIINHYFDGIFCINLDRKLKQFDVLNKQFIKYGIAVTRNRAYDGNWVAVKQEWDCINDKLQKKYPIEMKTPSNFGLIENQYAYGTLCSHISIIQQAIQKKLKKILIFEDDIIFHRNFKSELKKLNNILDWKLLYLGASQHDWDGIEILESYYHAKSSKGGFAYAIDCSIFDELLLLANQKEKSFDNCLAEIQTRYPNNCYVLYPNLVIADVSESELRQKRDMTQHSIKMKWDLSQYDY